MKAKLICYTLGNKSKQRGIFSRELFGYMDKSCRGQYTYKRKGLLSEIPHLRPVRSVIIVEEKNCKKIKNFLDKFKVKYNIYNIIINKNKLKIPPGLSH